MKVFIVIDDDGNPIKGYTDKDAAIRFANNNDYYYCLDRPIEVII